MLTGGRDRVGRRRALAVHGSIRPHQFGAARWRSHHPGSAEPLTVVVSGRVLTLILGAPTLIGLDEGAKLSGLQRIVENDANVAEGDGDGEDDADNGADSGA